MKGISLAFELSIKIFMESFTSKETTGIDVTVKIFLNIRCKILKNI